MAPPATVGAEMGTLCGIALIVDGDGCDMSGRVVVGGREFAQRVGGGCEKFGSRSDDCLEKADSVPSSCERLFRPCGFRRFFGTEFLKLNLKIYFKKRQENKKVFDKWYVCISP